MAGGRVHKPSRVGPSVGHRQLPQGSSTYLLTEPQEPPRRTKLLSHCHWSLSGLDLHPHAAVSVRVGGDCGRRFDWAEPSNLRTRHVNLWGDKNGSGAQSMPLSEQGPNLASTPKKLWRRNSGAGQRRMRHCPFRLLSTTHTGVCISLLSPVRHGDGMEWGGDVRSTRTQTPRWCCLWPSPSPGRRSLCRWPWPACRRSRRRRQRRRRRRATCPSARSRWRSCSRCSSPTSGASLPLRGGEGVGGSYCTTRGEDLG